MVDVVLNPPSPNNGRRGVVPRLAATLPPLPRVTAQVRRLQLGGEYASPWHHTILLPLPPPKLNMPLGAHCVEQ